MGRALPAAGPNCPLGWRVPGPSGLSLETLMAPERQSNNATAHIPHAKSELIAVASTREGGRGHAHAQLRFRGN